MRVDARDLGMYQDDEQEIGFVKTKKKHVPNEFKKTNTKKKNKPKRINRFEYM
jgi:hypothetical protein